MIDKEKCDSTNLSKAMEFIEILMEKEETKIKDSASSDAAATSSDTAKSASRRIMGKANYNSRQ